MGNTGKRLLQYALHYKKTIIIAIILLIFSICAELVGPFVAKRMIDQNILGIENTWYEVAPGTVYSVDYQGKTYVRADRVDKTTDVSQLSVAHILQVERGYYFIHENIKDSEGKREIVGGMLSLTNPNTGEARQYAAEPLSKGELYAFYKPEFPGLLQLAALYIGLLLVAAVFAYGQRLMLQTSANRIVQKMRTDVYAHTQKLPIQYYDNLAAGQVVSRITNDTEAIRELYVGVLANFVTGVLYMAAIYGALFILDYRLALLSLPIVPILVVWIIVYRKYAASYNRVIRTKLSEINAMINESIQGMPIIQAFRRQRKMLDEFEETNEYYFKHQNKMLNLNSLTSHNLVGVVRNILFVVVIWLFWGSSLGSLLTVGILYAYIDYMNRMFAPIVGMVNQLSNLETARVSAERVFKLMDEEGTEVAEGKLPRYKGEVVFENVYFAYKQNEYVLKNIQLHAKPGETVALVGHTGSGKSSIMNILFRFYDAQKGTISIDGQNIKEIPKQLLRQHMGIVLQDPFLFSGTIASNISLNHPSITRDMVIQALKDVGAYDMFNELPKGIDSPVSEKGSTFSSGQRQLISFARALAFNPAILILDEATSSIDSETEAIIQKALEVLKRGRTTFVIAHRLSTIRSADQIIVLDRGEIVEQGSHDKLMQLKGKYFAMYELQLGGAVQIV